MSTRHLNQKKSKKKSKKKAKKAAKKASEALEKMKSKITKALGKMAIENQRKFVISIGAYVGPKCRKKTITTTLAKEYETYKDFKAGLGVFTAKLNEKASVNDANRNRAAVNDDDEQDLILDDDDDDDEQDLILDDDEQNNHQAVPADNHQAPPPPEINAPDIDAPDIDAPDIDAPDINVSDSVSDSVAANNAPAQEINVVVDAQNNHQAPPADNRQAPPPCITNVRCRLHVSISAEVIASGAEVRVPIMRRFVNNMQRHRWNELEMEVEEKKERVVGRGRGRGRGKTFGDLLSRIPAPVKRFDDGRQIIYRFVELSVEPEKYMLSL